MKERGRMKFNMLKKSGLAALAVCLFASAGVMHAQTTGAGAAEAPGKIAVLNVRSAIVATAEGKKAQADLQAQFAPKQEDLQKMQSQIQDLQRRLNEGARTLSDQEKLKLQRQGELLTRRLQRSNDDLNEELNAAQGDIVDSIGGKLLIVLDRYAREHGYAVVLDTSAQGTPVVYGAAQVDITQDIVRLYDQAYPVKSDTSSSAPSSRPAAPRPAKKQP
jgi:outer membrane protein